MLKPHFRLPRPTITQIIIVMAALCIFMLLYLLAEHLLPGGGTPLPDALPASVTSQATLQESPAQTPANYRKIDWEDLMPKDWNLEKLWAEINWEDFGDNDPRAMAALQQLRKKLDNAPAEPSLDNTLVTITGFITPLEYTDQQISEFLLVPYFGACIHTPPPPANQIIHVIAGKPLPEEIMSMSIVTIDGKLSLHRGTSDMGASSYRMTVDHIRHAEGY